MGEQIAVMEVASKFLRNIERIRKPVHAPAKEIMPGDAAWFTPATNPKYTKIVRILEIEYEPTFGMDGEWTIFIAYWIYSGNQSILMTTWASEQELAAI